MELFFSMHPIPLSWELYIVQKNSKKPKKHFHVLCITASLSPHYLVEPCWLPHGLWWFICDLDPNLTFFVISISSCKWQMWQTVVYQFYQRMWRMLILVSYIGMRHIAAKVVWKSFPVAASDYILSSSVFAINRCLVNVWPFKAKQQIQLLFSVIIFNFIFYCNPFFTSQHLHYHRCSAACVFSGDSVKKIPSSKYFQLQLLQVLTLCRPFEPDKYIS